MTYSVGRNWFRTNANSLPVWENTTIGILVFLVTSWETSCMTITFETGEKINWFETSFLFNLMNIRNLVTAQIGVLSLQLLWIEYVLYLHLFRYCSCSTKLNRIKAKHLIELMWRCVNIWRICNKMIVRYTHTYTCTRHTAHTMLTYDNFWQTNQSFGAISPTPPLSFVLSLSLMK